MKSEEGKIIIVYKEEGGNYRANITYDMKKSTLKRICKRGTYLYRRIHILGNVGDLFCYALF